METADGKGNSTFHLGLTKNGKEKVQRDVGGLEKGQWAGNVVSTGRQCQEVSAPFTLLWESYYCGTSNYFSPCEASQKIALL